jgi:integrase
VEGSPAARARGQEGCRRGSAPRRYALAGPAAVHGQPGHAIRQGALALRFAILTAARTNEVLGATWGEIDMLPPRKVTIGRDEIGEVNGGAHQINHLCLMACLTMRAAG